MIVRMFLNLFFAFIFSVTAAQSKTLEIITMGAADSVAIHARIYAMHVKKYLPEVNEIVVKNMPAAAGVAAVSYVYNTKDPDSLTIGIVRKTLNMIAFGKNSKVDYNPLELTWIGSFEDGKKDAGIIWVNNDNDISYYKTNTLILGAQTSLSYNLGDVIEEVLDIQIKIIKGYQNQALFLAFSNKEVDAFHNPYSVVRARKATGFSYGEKMNALIQFGNGVNRHPHFKNVPTIMELITTEKQKRILEFYEKDFILTKPVIASPHLSEHNKKIITESFNKTVVDKQFIEDSNKVGYEIDAIKAEEAYKIVKELYELSKKVEIK